MKTLFLIVLLSPLLLTAQEKLVLQGQIKGLKNGSTVFISDVNRPTDTLAKAKSVNGSFVLKASIKDPLPLNLVFGPGQSAMTFLGPSTVKVTGDIQKLNALKYTGSAIPADFQQFQKTFDPLFASMSATGQLVQSGRGNDSVMRALNLVRDSIRRNVEAFISKRRSSPVSAFLLAITMQLSTDISQTEQLYVRLRPAAVKNMYGVYVGDAIADSRIGAVGTMAQDFTQTDTAGVNVSLSSFRGKYVLVDFWASWCGPCRQENPNVVANFNKFSSKNFTVLGVSLDRPGQKDRWLQAIHKDNLTWTHVSDLQFWENAVAKQYRVQTIPQNLLIGPDGKIVAKDLRGPALEAKLCELLGCELKAF